MNWNGLQQYGEPVVIEKEQYLFHQGDPLQGFYIVEQGVVAISILRHDGTERVIDFVYPGYFIGEQVLRESISFTTAKGIERSLLRFYPKKMYVRLLEQKPELAEILLHSLIKKVRNLIKVNAIVNENIEQQLAHLLLTIYEKTNSLELSALSQNMLANALGKSRVAVWSVLKKWQQQQIIDTTRCFIVIKNLEKLKSQIII